MPLQKSIEMDTGVTATYWFIMHRRIDYANVQMEIHIGGYRDNEARVAGKRPLIEHTLYVAEADIPGGNMDSVTRNQIYNKLATLPMFSGGTVVP